MTNSRALLPSLLVLFTLLSGCSRTYPYLFQPDTCNCEVYTYNDPQNRLEIEFRAEYGVDERISTRVEIEFRNESRDTLSLQQATIKGTSRNIRYQYNDRAVPLPYAVIAPRGRYTVLFEGSDTEVVENPWHKIAGERTVLEIDGLMLGGRLLPPIRVELVPVNPKLSS